MSYGFAIEEVRIKGDQMPDATVELAPGLSLITGPSDTGKSFIADAINHVFGAQSQLRDLPERGFYERVLVQIRAYSTGRAYTLERAWNGGAIALFDGIAAEVRNDSEGTTLKAVHQPNDQSVSGFLLGLSGLLGKQVRTNASGAKDSLSFRNLPNYILIQEERVITKLSPIFSGQNTDVTKDASIFRCLLTGIDDSAVHTQPEPKVRKALDAGRMEVLGSLITQANERIASLGKTEEELGRELDSVESAITGQTSFIQSLSAELDARESDLKRLWSTRQEHAAREEQIMALTERFHLLMDHYDADIARLESTQESGRLLVQLSEGPCPLCGAEPQDHRHSGLLKSEDVEQLTQACSAEQSKIVRLKEDLVATLGRLAQEAIEIENTTADLDKQISEMNLRIAQDLEPRVSLTKEGFSELLKHRQEVERALSYFDELRRLEGSRLTFQSKTKLEAEKQTFTTTPPRVTDELAQIVQELLAAWKYPDLQRVVFDSESNDIIVNGKQRGSHGKGYRALTYTAFSVAIMLFCRRRNLPHPGFVLVDSPLVTYRKPDKAETDDDLINEGMVPPFYHYLTDLPDDCQVIVIENDPPSDYVISRAAYTHFTKNDSVGRFGFLLPSLRGPEA